MADAGGMSKNVSDQIIERLHAWGVGRVFGYPGDGINGVMGALNRAKDKIEFVQARHEELAAFMACAHAKFTGEVGVCIATSGPGAIHLLNGLYDAKADHQPVVAIVGQQARSALGGDYQQEVDLMALFKDVAHEYVHMATVPAQVRHLVDRAMRIARDQPTVTCIKQPNDLQTEKAVETPPREHGTVHSGIGMTLRHPVPSEDDLKFAASILNDGKRVAMLVGAGALHASAEVKEVAEKLGAGVAKALLGKAVLPDTLPYVTGSIGMLGTQPSWELMERCDTLLMVGSSFPYAEFLPKEGAARGVQIDVDGRRLSMRYPMEVNLVGDSKLTLRALLPLLEEKTDRSWREEIEDNVAQWWRVVNSRSLIDAKPINPQHVFRELSPQLPDDAIVICDSGTSAVWYARDLVFREGMMGSVSGGLATMGCSLPYALAAKMAHPTRPVIATLGDGAMQMTGVNGLITLTRYWREWKDKRFIVMVLNNLDLNMVTWEQRGTEGDPKFEGSQDLPCFPYAEYAKLLGLHGIRCEDPKQVRSVWEEALSADRPVVIDMVTDANIPPVPPHITSKQLKHYFSALMHKDPESMEIVKAAAKEWWAGVKK
jgi:pyruvate dehydrogenase (quinone)